MGPGVCPTLPLARGAIFIQEEHRLDKNDQSELRILGRVSTLVGNSISTPTSQTLLRGLRLSLFLSNIHIIFQTSS